MKLENFENPDKVETYVKGYARAVGFEESEWKINITPSARDKISGKNFLFPGKITQIDERYSYGIGKFNHGDKKISHLVIRTNDAGWFVIKPSRSSESSFSFNIPPGVLISKDADIFGLDEYYLRRILTEK